MLRKGFIVISLLVLFSRTQVYKTSVLTDKAPANGILNCKIQTLDIKNAELLMLDKTALSNSIYDSIRISLYQKGFNLSDTADVSIDIRILVEGNDIINNRQSITIVSDFKTEQGLLSSFLISTDSKLLLANKSEFINEWNQILEAMKTRYPQK